MSTKEAIWQFSIFYIPLTLLTTLVSTRKLEGWVAAGCAYFWIVGLIIWAKHKANKHFMSEEAKTYTVTDRRRTSPDYQPEPKPVCRVCGSLQVHTQDYNKPTMGCVEEFRREIRTLEEQLAKFRENQPPI